jgi:peroxiredoxin
MNLSAPLIALAFFAAGAASAHDVGPPVGARVPALSVTTSGGEAATLRDLAGPKGVVLVFYRSARWCPYCQAQLLSLREAPEVLARRGYKLAAISYDAPDVLARFTAQRDINYPLLSDPGSRTIDAFGLRDPQYKPGSLAYGVPQPAIFVISRDGIIRAKLAEEGYKTRPPLEAVLSSIDRLAPR